MSANAGAALDQAFDHCAALVRAEDPDRYFAALFAPPAARRGLNALHAFNLELARIRDVIRDPMAGEIRLQWWHDALAGQGRGDVAANPVMAALAATIETARLPLAPLLALIEARRFDLYDDPMPTMGDLEGHAGETASALIRLGTLVLAAGRDPGFAAAAGHAGVAVALTRLMRALPWHARRGQLYLPLDVLSRHGITREDVVAGQDSPALRAALPELRVQARRHIGEAKAALAGAPVAIAPAFLPLALCEPYLRLMERADYQPFVTRIERPAWRTILTLWRAARRFPNL